MNFYCLIVMLAYWVKWAIVCFMIIAFLHFFYEYFKNKLTTPRVVNLVSDKAKKEVNEILVESQNMENELGKFLNNEMKKD